VALGRPGPIEASVRFDLSVVNDVAVGRNFSGMKPHLHLGQTHDRAITLRRVDCLKSSGLGSVDTERDTRVPPTVARRNPTRR
jgi:hypothetical protein